MDPQLTFPSALSKKLARDAETGLRRAVPVDVGWWNSSLREYGLAGGPLAASTSGDDEAPTQSGVAELRRADVRACADVTDDQSALRLLWYSLAWGSGRKLRLAKKRFQAVKATNGVPSLLREVAELSKSDPRGAFQLMRPGRYNAIKYLGPAFFTKYLYFAGGGAEDHPCLILDSRVATRLRDQCGWDSLHRQGPWPADTYQRYCHLVQQWAEEQSTALGRCVRRDEIEFVLFDRP